MVATNTPTEPVPSAAPTAPTAPTAEFIAAFNAQLREAKAEALSVLVTILRLDTDKDLAIRTQQRLAATAILRVKELKPPKPPRVSKPLSRAVGEDKLRRKPESGEGKSNSNTLPRSLKSLDTTALTALAHQAFGPDSEFRAMDKIRLARHLAFEEARQARAEMKTQRAQARALLRRPDS